MRVLCVLLLSSFALAESPCVVLSTAPPPTGIATWSQAGKSQRHALLWIAGEYPSGVPFRSQIKDKDVQKIKDKGGRVVLLDSQYTRDDVDKAKAECDK